MLRISCMQDYTGQKIPKSRCQLPTVDFTLLTLVLRDCALRLPAGHFVSRTSCNVAVTIDLQRARMKWTRMLMMCTV